MTWLSGSVFFEAEDEKLSLKVLQVAEENIKFVKRNGSGMTHSINLERHSRVGGNLNSYHYYRLRTIINQNYFHEIKKNIMANIKDNVISLFGNNKVAQNGGVKYSDLLNDFIKPFENDFPNGYEIDDIFMFSIHAWNFANLGKAMPPEEFQNVISPPEMPDEENILLQKMLALKADKFDKFDRYILEYAFEEENDEEIKLSVVTGDVEDFLASIQNEFAHQPIQEDFEENYINRYAIVLKPQQCFFDWVNNLYPDDKVTEVEEANIYLVDDGIDDLEKWLMKKFDKFFILELNDWHTNKKEWPQKRNYKMFKQWFQVDVSTMIYDLERRPIVKED